MKDYRRSNLSYITIDDLYNVYCLTLLFIHGKCRKHNLIQFALDTAAVVEFVFGYVVTDAVSPPQAPNLSTETPNLHYIKTEQCESINKHQHIFSLLMEISRLIC